MCGAWLEPRPAGLRVRSDGFSRRSQNLLKPAEAHLPGNLAEASHIPWPVESPRHGFLPPRSPLVPCLGNTRRPSIASSGAPGGTRRLCLAGEKRLAEEARTGK